MGTTRIEANDGWRYTVDATLEVVSCPTCSMLYAIPARLLVAARDEKPGLGASGITLWCPAGHTWGFDRVSDKQRLKRERERVASLRAELDQTEASLRAQRGAATRARNERDRLKRRAAAGVCPCCSRTFKQLARHMASQHPDFPGDDAA